MNKDVLKTLGAALAVGVFFGYGAFRLASGEDPDRDGTAFFTLGAVMLGIGIAVLLLDKRDKDK